MPRRAVALATGMGTLTLTDLTVDLPPASAGSASRFSGCAGWEAGGRWQVHRARTRVAEARSPDAKAGARVPAVHHSHRALKTSVVALRKAVFGVGPASEGAPPRRGSRSPGSTFPPSLAAGLPLVGALPAFGYGDLSFDMTADAAWDEAARTVALRDVTIWVRISAPSASPLCSGASGRNCSPAASRRRPCCCSRAMSRTFDLTVENSGLFERFLAAQAKELSLKPDELRKEYVTASVLGVPVILGNGPAAKNIGAAMGQFVMNPGQADDPRQIEGAHGHRLRGTRHRRFPGLRARPARHRGEGELSQISPRSPRGAGRRGWSSSRRPKPGPAGAGAGRG